jgi:heat shock protein HslJ
VRTISTIALLAALLAACTSGPTPDMQQLVGTTWHLVSIEGRTPEPNADVQMAFEEERMSGHSGINRFTGGWSLTDGTFSAGPLASTRAAGAPALMDQEHRLLMAIEAADRAVIDGDRLVLRSGDRDLLVFERAR